MTREDFLEGVDYIGALLEFAYEHGFEDVFEDVVTDDEREELIEEEARELLRYEGWRECMNYLNNRDCDGGYDYFERDGNDFIGIDEYKFDEYKEIVLERCDEHENFWETDEVTEEASVEEDGIEESELSDFLSNITKVA